MLTNDTIADNDADGDGAGVYVYGGADVVTINTLLAANSLHDCNASLDSHGYNLADDSTCGLAGTNDQQGVDPLLGSLQNNGGPTDTQLPAGTSPVVDAGFDASCPTDDQRGTARPQGPHCDIGAVEVASAAPAVSASQSTVSASPTSVAADGATTSTITVTLKDSGGNPISGKTVTLTAGGGSSTIATVSGTTSASGVATFTVKDATAESVTYTAHDTSDTVDVTQTATIGFTAVAPPPPAVANPAESTVSASPTSVAADGATTSTITVTLKDSGGNPVPGKTVTLTAGGGSSTIATVSGTTSASGVATFTVKDATAESVTYTAHDTSDTVDVTQTATIGFTTPTSSGGGSSSGSPPAQQGPSLSISVSGAPTVNSPTTFTATLADGGATFIEYAWGFGDGTTVPPTGSTIAHHYQHAGTFTVSVIATDSSTGATIASASTTVTVAPEAPRIGLTVTPRIPTAGVPANFHVDTFGVTPVSVKWNFGDGTRPPGRRTRPRIRMPPQARTRRP